MTTFLKNTAVHVVVPVGILYLLVWDETVEYNEMFLSCDLQEPSTSHYKLRWIHIVICLDGHIYCLPLVCNISGTFDLVQICQNPIPLSPMKVSFLDRDNIVRKRYFKIIDCMCNVQIFGIYTAISSDVQSHMKTSTVFVSHSESSLCL